MKSKRRTLLKLVGGTIGATVAGAGGAVGWLFWQSRERPLHYSFAAASMSPVALEPTPDCAGYEATRAQTQGPYYTPDTPHRSNLREPGMAGLPLVVEGRVLTTDCLPVPGAVLDVWSCDAAGVYDNEGFRLRGHQFTDNDGRFRLETIKPAAYTDFGFSRTPHLHVRVQGPGTRLLTTQLYFPDEPMNASDGIFSESLLMATTETDGDLHARFDFVLRPAPTRTA
ncbi:MAG: intradiol ring-cleavage dioxygenase [Pseudomonadota bacterium]